MWAVVGLGNPGRKYADTRHNAGFLFVQSVAKSWDVRVKKSRYLSKTAEVNRGTERVVLVLPQTYMNECGRAVGELVRGLRLETGRLLVVYDDVDIPLGEIRVRKDGGPGTHKGMLSIVGEIATKKFPRLRLGIGPGPQSGDIVPFVLAPFRRDEKKRFEKSLDKGRTALDLILDGRIETAMNDFN